MLFIYNPCPVFSIDTKKIAPLATPTTPVLDVDSPSSPCHRFNSDFIQVPSLLSAPYDSDLGYEKALYPARKLLP